MPSPAPSQFDVILTREEGLQRGLSSRQLSMIAIGGAIGTGLFLGSGFAISFAGPAVLLSYAIGALITLLLMGCLAEMTVAHPTSGSFGAWAEFYLSPLAGVLVRVAYWAGVVFAMGTEVSAIAVYMQFWFPAVPGTFWMVGVSLLLLLANVLSVRVFGVVEYSFSLLKVLAIVTFLGLGAWLLLANARGSGAPLLQHYVSHGGIFPHGADGMWTAVLVALFSYFSIEMIAVAAGEAKDPQRAITHAFRVTMVRLALFYLLTLALVLAIVPWPDLANGQARSPFVLVMEHVGIAHAAGVMNFVILVAALSAMNSQLYICARMLFSLARGGFVPRRFGALSSRGIPVPALLVSLSGIGLAAVLNAVYHDRSFLIMLAISMFGPLFTWFMVFVTHLRFRRSVDARTLHFRMWGFPYTTLLGAALMLAALLTTLRVPVFRPTLLYGLPALALIALFYAVQRRRAEHPTGQHLSRTSNEGTNA